MKALLPLLLLALLAPAEALQADGDHTVVATRVSLLIGFPDDPEASGQGTLIVPGMVIPVLEGAGSNPAKLAEPEEPTTHSWDKIASGLRKTLRLGDIDVRYDISLDLEMGRARELEPPTSISDVRLSLELLAFAPTSATYEVRFYKGSETITDTRVAAFRGQRTLVGGVDGDEAPFLFLVIEPAPVGDSASADQSSSSLDPSFKPPLLTFRTPLRHPAKARTFKMEGSVVVRALIRSDGRVASTEVIRGENALFGKAASDSVRQWRFEPATRDGVPVDVYHNVTVRFQR